MMVSQVHVMKRDYSIKQKKMIDNHEIHFNSNVVVYNHNKVISFDKPSFGKK